jgi:hypothetical protein
MSETWIEKTIREKLIEIGADGLCHFECGCSIGSGLMPCGEALCSCVPAKNNPDRAKQEGAGFWMEPMPGCIRTCRVCGCTDYNCAVCIERTGEPCHWAEEDLCSACLGF